MFCNKCGAEVTPGQKFCTQCGAQIQLQPQMQPRPQAQPQTQPQMQAQPKADKPGKKKTGLIIAIILVIVLLLAILLGVIGYTVFNYIVKNDTGSYSESYTEVVTEVEDDDKTEVKPEEAQPEVAAETEETADSEVLTDDLTSTEGTDLIPYGYSDVYASNDKVVIVPNGTITDDTVLWNGKTIGGFCDYIDKDVFGGQSPMDRDLLYKLVAIHEIDPQLIPDDKTFETVMKYCLVVAAEFRDAGAVMNKAVFTPSQPNKYHYEMDVNGETSIWTIDYDTQEVTLNNGKTEYSSAGDYGMFTEQTMAIWMYAISEYFELN